MKLAIIYDPQCPKLTPQAYSQTYRDMFIALIEKFDDVRHITSNCSAGDIDADVIVFFDIHSSHHIQIDGIENHKAVKYEYFNDPWQPEFNGKYKDGSVVHKLNAEQRTKRAIDRGVNFIICPYSNLYYRYIHPHTDTDMLLWFPVAPNIERFMGRLARLNGRENKVLLNGHIWQGDVGFRPYNFRRWAYTQSYCDSIEHSILNKTVPSGMEYPNFLSQHAGSLALCDTHICPKYSEIPLAGCVTFAQYLYDYEQMGFKDGESCIYVTKSNLEKKIKDFKGNVESYQKIADSGRRLMEENWTASHFGNFIYKHAEKLCRSKQS